MEVIMKKIYLILTSTLLFQGVTVTQQAYANISLVEKQQELYQGLSSLYIDTNTFDIIKEKLGSERQNAAKRLDVIAQRLKRSLILLRNSIKPRYKNSVLTVEEVEQERKNNQIPVFIAPRGDFESLSRSLNEIVKAPKEDLGVKRDNILDAIFEEKPQLKTHLEKLAKYTKETALLIPINFYINTEKK